MNPPLENYEDQVDEARALQESGLAISGLFGILGAWLLENLDCLNPSCRRWFETTYKRELELLAELKSQRRHMLDEIEERRK